MVVRCDAKVIGASARDGQNGKYYLVNLVTDDDDCYSLMASVEAYTQAKSIQFGEEQIVVLDLRRYGRDWAVRIVDFENHME